MRILVWFTVGFTAACAAAAYWLTPMWLWVCAGVALICAVACFFLKKKGFSIAGVVLLGCVAGLIWNWGYHQLFLRHAVELDGQKLETQITVTDYSYQTDHGVNVRGSFDCAGRDYPVMIYLHQACTLQPGDQLRGLFYFRYTSRGGEDAPTYHQADGVFLLASTSEYELLQEDGRSGTFPVELRRKITQLLDRIFPPDTAGFARALLLGDSTNITYEMNTAFSVSGIRHIIAVSGLHVSILITLISFLCGHHRQLTAIVGIPVLLIFAAVAGFTPSVVRACVMQGLVILAMAVNKEYDPPTALAFAVLLLLAVNPRSITSVGLQLSVACVIGLIAFSRPIYDYLRGRKWMASTKGKDLRTKLVRGILMSLSISLSVWIVTVPLCAVYFDTVSLVSLATNLLTVWLVSYIFYFIVAACIFGALWLPLGMGLAWLASWPMRLVQWVAAVLSKIPVAAVYTCSVYIVIWIVGCYLLLGVFAVLKFRRPKLLLLGVAASLTIALGASWLEPKTDAFRVSILDVGQGQCIVLKHQEQYYVVDCGGSSGAGAADSCAQYLLSRGIFYIDGLILTHYDEDHASGAAYLLERVPALRLYLPDIDGESAVRQQLQERYGEMIQWVSDTWEIPAGEMRLVCSRNEKSDNESGICVLFQPDNYDILITGDRSISGEKALMERIDLPQLELLVAGHHGSAGATGLSLLEQTMPAAVAISVGKDNSYGHPAEELLQRLDLFGCQVLRTDIDGTIEFRG